MADDRSAAEKWPRLPYRMVRVPLPLYLALSALAQDGERPLAVELRRALRAWLRQNGRQPE